jgi:hypothetical protein
MIAVLGFLGWRFKKFDNDGQVKNATKGLIVRGLGRLFK